MPGIAALLAAAGLPVPGEDDRPVRFLVARAGDELVGCIAREDGGDAALLRSCAVAAARRGEGIGGLLVRALGERAHADGAACLYLLTLDAMPFFARLGFAPVPRESAPPAIAASREFEIHHCDRATLMRATLPLF
jgi:amino-acid N-acetyltransferase